MAKPVSYDRWKGAEGGVLSEPTKEQIERLHRLVEFLRLEVSTRESADLDLLLGAYEERGREVDGWKSRFKAIVDEDRPDMAGNAVLHLKAEVERLRPLQSPSLFAEVERLRAELDFSRDAWKVRAEQAEAEVERLRHQTSKMAEDLSLCNAAVERAEQAEARLARVVEAWGKADVQHASNCDRFKFRPPEPGEKDWRACSCGLTAFAAALAAALPEEDTFDARLRRSWLPAAQEKA